MQRLNSMAPATSMAPSLLPPSPGVATPRFTTIATCSNTRSRRGIPSCISSPGAATEAVVLTHPTVPQSEGFRPDGRQVGKADRRAKIKTMTDRHVVSLVRLLSAIGLTVAIAAPAAAQSLGEMAKKEEARRKAVKTPGKVLTNDTIRSVPAPSVPAAPAPASTSDKGIDGAADKKPKPEGDRKAQ